MSKNCIIFAVERNKDNTTTKKDRKNEKDLQQTERG